MHAEERWPLGPLCCSLSVVKKAILLKVLALPAGTATINTYLIKEPLTNCAQ